jgi:hypothetical protein
MHAPSRQREEDAMHTRRSAKRACLRIGAVLLISCALGCPITDPEPIAGAGGEGGISGAGGSGAGGISGTTGTGGISGFVGDTGGGPSIGTEDGSSGITGRAGGGASGSDN